MAERSDEAGIILAQSLLNSSAGHRPVSKYVKNVHMIVSTLFSNVNTVGNPLLM